MENKKESLLIRIVGILFFVLGAFIGKYQWAAFFLVIIGAIVFRWIAVKYDRHKLDPMLPAIAVLGGRLSWSLVGLFYGGQMAYAVIPDVILLIVGMVWLALRPGLGAVILLVLYNCIALIYAFTRIFSMAFQVSMFAALLLHLFLEASAIIFLLVGLKKIRNLDDSNFNWYYALGDKREGPVSKEEVQQLITQGTLDQDSLIWSETLDQWTPVKSIDYFKPKTGRTPPPLPANSDVPYEDVN